MWLSFNGTHHRYICDFCEKTTKNIEITKFYTMKKSKTLEEISTYTKLYVKDYKYIPIAILCIPLFLIRLIAAIIYDILHIGRLISFRHSVKKNQ